MVSSLSSSLLSQASQIFRARFPLYIQHSVRYASLNSAISNGIRKDRPSNESRGRRWDRTDQRTEKIQCKRDWQRRGRVRASTEPVKPYYQKESAKPAKKGKWKPDEPVSLVSRVSIVGPVSVPYTTPISEFIYGYSAVQAAILSRRRKIYTLYIYLPDKDVSKTAETQYNSLQKYAAAAGAKVRLVSGTWAKIMDKMSDSRPHNGFIAEVSPLPKIPAMCFEAVPSTTASHFNVDVAPQSREEADINGSDGRVPIVSRLLQTAGGFEPQRPSRYPFTLLLDGILDPGNLGAIIRSAYFFGVDAIAFSSRNSAPMSPTTMKASAGAAENIPLVSIHDPLSFIDATRRNGWRFFAAEVPSFAMGGGSEQFRGVPMLWPQDLSSELQESPCILMLGGEGWGLSNSLKRKTDAFVAIAGARTSDLSNDPARVDSLNVSVASALLCQAFLSGQSLPQHMPTTPARTEQTEGPSQESGEESDNRIF